MRAYWPRLIAYGPAKDCHYRLFARSAPENRVCHILRMRWLVMGSVAAMVTGLAVVLVRRGSTGEGIGHNTPDAFHANDNVSHNSGPF